MIMTTRQINGDKPVVIDFWATWCGPCRMISPVLEKLSNDPSFTGVEFYKVDVDEQDQISQEVGVRAVRRISCCCFILS
jgi:thioredoxin 1